MHRMAPAEQRLEARHLAVGEANDRLVVQLEFAVLGRAPQVGLERVTVARLLAHLRAIEAEGSAPGGP